MRPGRVTAWVPSRRCEAAWRDAPPDPRPLTVDQHHHLVASLGHAGEDPAEAPWIGFSCRLESAEPSSVAAALASFFDRHEGLRCDYRRAGDGFTRVVLPPGATEFEPLAFGVLDDARAAHACVTEHLSATAQPHVWPRAGFLTVDDGVHVTLYAAFDHVAFDLGSLHAAVDEIPLLHRAYARGDGPDPLLALPASHLDHAVAERERLAGVGPDDPRLEPWRALLAGGGVPGLPPASGVRRTDRLAHELVSMPLATAGETGELAELLAERETRLEDALLALALRAVAALEGVAPVAVPALLAVPGRSEEQAGSIGWFTGIVPLPLVVDPAAPLVALAREVRETCDRSGVEPLPAPVVSRLLGVPVRPSFVLAVVDHRTGPGVEAWRTHRAQAYLGHVPAGDQLHLWISCLPERTFLEARHPATPECGAWVATLSVTIRRAVLAELDPRPAPARAPAVAPAG
ncbi:hypothetical protein [Nocardioides solisilvae]|uniref:hypothetical protein n=1 Tax=Nocardioides solisilvae TaxID=1542435 RepID=UPI0013A536CE|nr:hypothetical protein [Nocardioides solisilvae]